MSMERRAAWGALTGGASMITHLAVAFVLAPILLHRLGDTNYGLWVLVLSATGYFGIFDVGIRSAVVRFVAAHHASGDHDGLHHSVSAALFVYIVVGAMVLSVAIAAAYALQEWFHVPAVLLGVVRAMVLLLGADTALGLPCSVFGGVLEGLQRFTFINVTQIAISLARGVLIVIVLNLGGGLLAVAAAAVAVHLIGSGVIVLRALRFLPAFTLRANLSRNTLRKLGRHSASAFLMSVADRVRFQSDALVIGAFSGPAAIAYFALAARLSDVAGKLVQMMAQVVTPASSHLHASGEQARLRKVLVHANQACAWLVLPVSAVLILCGKSVIALWVGERYVSIYPVFVILLGGKMLFFCQAAAPRVLLGTGGHGRFVRLLAVEGIGNLLLSVALAPHWGIVGVAVGTAVPMALTSVVLLPRLLTHLTGVSALRYLKTVYFAPAMCAAAVLFLGMAQRQFTHGPWAWALEITFAAGAAGAPIRRSVAWLRLPSAGRSAGTVTRRA